MMIVKVPAHLLRVGDYLMMGEPGERKRRYCVTWIIDGDRFVVRPAGLFDELGLWFKRWKR